MKKQPHAQTAKPSSIRNEQTARPSVIRKQEQIRGAAGQVSHPEDHLTLILLALVFIAAASLRYFLSLQLSQNPLVKPDELIYTNIAKSIALHGEVLLRGQQVVYDSLLYPLVLAPLYLLPDNFDIYRGIQLINAILMASAVFPGYLLAKRLLKTERHAWIAVLFLLILPDAVMSQLAMTESLCYPLLMWMLYIAYRAFDGVFQWRDAVLAAAAGALLYFAKPGLIAVPAVFCLVFLVSAALERSRRRLLLAAGTTVLLLAFLGLIRLICQYVFHINYGLASIYGEHYRALTPASLYVVLQGVVLLLYFFPVAACVVPAILPFAHMRRMEESKKYFTLTVLISLISLIVGTSYAVFLPEWTGVLFAGRTHIRYLAAFIPVLAMLVLSPELKGQKLNWPSLILLTLLFAANCLLTPAATRFTGSELMDALAMSAFIKDWGGLPTRTIALVLLLAGIPAAVLILRRKGWTQGVRRAFLYVFIAVMLINNVSAYAMLNSGTADAPMAADARETYKLAKGHSVLYVADNNYLMGNGMALDVRFRDQLQTVTLNDIATSMLDSDGTYKPFMPRAYWPTYPDRLTPNADMIIVDGGLWPLLKLAPDLTHTVTRNGYYVLVPISKGKPWLKSILAGQDLGSVPANKICTIVLFSQPAGTIRLRLRVVAAQGEQTMILQTSAGDTVSLPITQDDAWQEVSLSLAGGDVEQIDMFCPTSDMTVKEYEVLPQE